MQQVTIISINEAEIRKYFEQGNIHLIFDVSGVIRFTQPFKIKGNTRIEVLPHRQIISTNYRMWLNESNISISGWRSYVGNKGKQLDNADCFNIGNHDYTIENITLEQCVGLLSVDGALDVWGEKGGADNRANVRNLTVRNCIFGFPMFNAGHSKVEHAMVALLEGLEDSLLENNLFIANEISYRFPRLRASKNTTLRGNVWYGFGGSNIAGVNRCDNVTFENERYITVGHLAGAVYEVEDSTITLINNSLENDSGVQFAKVKANSNSKVTEKNSALPQKVSPIDMSLYSAPNSVLPPKVTPIDMSLYGAPNRTPLELSLIKQINAREWITLVDSLEEVPGYDSVEDIPPVEPPKPDPLPQPLPEPEEPTGYDLHVHFHIHVDEDMKAEIARFLQWLKASNQSET